MVHDFLTKLPTEYPIPGGEIRIPTPPELLGRSLAAEVPIDLLRSVPRDSLALTINPAPTERFAPCDHLGKNTFASPYELAIQCLTCYEADLPYPRSMALDDPTEALMVPAGTELWAPAETVLFHVVPLGDGCSVRASSTPEGQPVLAKILDQIGSLWPEAEPPIERWRKSVQPPATRGRKPGSGDLAALPLITFHRKYWKLFEDKKSRDQGRPIQLELGSHLKPGITVAAITIHRYLKGENRHEQPGVELRWPPEKDYKTWIKEKTINNSE